MSIITVANLGKQFGPQILFEGASLNFDKGKCYGIVGANGSGKSTFLRILMGQEEPSEGQVTLQRRARIGVLGQDHFQYEDTRILDVVMMGHAELWEAMVEKEAILAKAHEHFDGDRYQVLEDVILQHDGYSLEARAGEILEGLRIPTAVHEQPMSTLSGGFKLRVLLAQTLAADPDALLLDEPTNHLDILSIRWLEKFLEEYEGCAIVISHDHRFLGNICTHIVDVDYERITLYTGDYDAFVRQKAEERERKEAEINKREQEIADHRAFIDRFKAKASKARQAQSKMKRMEKIVIDKLPQTSRRYPRFVFEQVRPSGKDVLEAVGISKAYGDKVVLKDVDLSVRRGDKLAIIGPNGIGKSTLLKILVDGLEADAGEIEWGYETHPGYFAQDHHDQIDETSSHTVISWLWESCPGEGTGFVRGKLAMVLFGNDDVEKKLGALSGGEAARLIFARLGVTKPNVMVLDEPTNHLDLEGIEALAEALNEYEGTILFVSHDRWFVSKVANRILEITPEGLNDYRGTYEEYLQACGDDHLDADEAVRRARAEKRAARAS